MVSQLEEGRITELEYRLVTEEGKLIDHIHYWEDGGATYHYRYNSWEIIRGQEGDKWKCLPELLGPCDESKLQNKDGLYFQATQDLQRHDAVNRKFVRNEEDTSLAQTVKSGLEFLDANHGCDN